MRIFIFLLFTALFSIQFSFSQTLRDFKKKTEENTKERTAMLDLLRSDIKNYLEQDVVFVVNHFKVYGSYAWMEGTVQRKDGKEIVFTEDAYDCCHVEALFKKVNGAWILKENGAFSTDVWYVCIVSNYPEASRQIFSEQILSNQENCRN
jgi:endoglucanase Acf2